MYQCEHVFYDSDSSEDLGATIFSDNLNLGMGHFMTSRRAVTITGMLVWGLSPNGKKCYFQASELVFTRKYGDEIQYYRYFR